jgi:hypothetical protein
MWRRAWFENVGRRRLFGDCKRPRVSEILLYSTILMHRLGSFGIVVSAARRVCFLAQGPCHSGVTYTSRRHIGQVRYLGLYCFVFDGLSCPL